MICIMQGDAYEIALTLNDEENHAIVDTDVADVEITLGGIRKTYADGDVLYDDGKWLFPVTQEETMKCLPSISGLQVRVKYALGDVVGATIGNVYVTASASNEVL